MMNASRCNGSEVTICSLIFPVFCFHFHTKHLGLDRAQWPVHFHAVPALCRDLYTRGPVMGFLLILAIFYSDGSRHTALIKEIDGCVVQGGFLR